MASIVKKRDRYYARIIYNDSNGKRREKTFSLMTKQETVAKQKLPEVQQREDLFKAGQITLKQVVNGDIERSMPLTEDFIEHQKLMGRSPGTIELYNTTFKITEQIVNLRNPELLKRDDFKVLVTTLKNIYENNHTINIHLRNIRAYLNWLLNEGKISKMPFQITSFKTAKRKPHYFSRKEMIKILLAARKDKELFARIVVHAGTGLRLNEFDKSFYHEGFVRTYDPCKNGLERDVPISDEVLKY